MANLLPTYNVHYLTRGSEPPGMISGASGLTATLEPHALLRLTFHPMGNFPNMPRHDVEQYVVVGAAAAGRQTEGIFLLKVARIPASFTVTVLVMIRTPIKVNSRPASKQSNVKSAVTLSTFKLACAVNRFNSAAC